MNAYAGMVCLDKPPGITSFQALSVVKKKLGTGKVGHCGTLDSFASGLLVVCVGSMTRLVSYVTGFDKEYQAVIRFGKETDTLDPEGEVIHQGVIPDYSELLRLRPRFVGSLRQRPPAFSAVHIRGERAYKLARRGLPVDMPERSVTVHDFSFTGWEEPDLAGRIRCSSGTYIRSLARDLGTAAGSFAYLLELRRTRVGSFLVEEAVLPQDFEPSRDLLSGRECFARLPEINLAAVDPKYVPWILTGKTPELHWCNPSPEKPGLWALFDDEDHFLALTEKKQTSLTYRFVAAQR